MQYVMKVTREALNVLYNSDVEFYEDFNGEVSFDSEEEYDKAEEILRNSRKRTRRTLGGK